MRVERQTLADRKASSWASVWPRVPLSARGLTALGGVLYLLGFGAPSLAASPTAVQIPMPKPPSEEAPSPEPAKPEQKPDATPAKPDAAPMSKEELERLSKSVSDRDLKEVEKKLEQSRQEQKALRDKADALAQEIEALQKELVSAADAAQDTEENLSGLEDKLKDLNQREQALKTELVSRNDQLREVLTALERQASRPPEAILVQPMPAQDAIRSAILLRSVVPQLHDKAGALRSQLAELLALRKQISGQKRDIAQTGKKLDKQQSKLASLLERKQALQKSTLEASDAAAKRADELASNASSMRDLLERLEVERKRREEEERQRQQAEARRVAALLASKPNAPEPAKPPAAKKDERPRPVEPPPSAEPQTAVLSSTPDPEPPPNDEPAKITPAVAHSPTQRLRSFEEQRGRMPLPARGQIVARYGQSDGLGTAQKGIVLKTRAKAQIVAVADGMVAFAGSFRGYGQLLIMEHSGGYHTLLSGMSRIDVAVGQKILAGEPVGVMDDSDGPNLYLELRQDGQPINPLPWLTARKG